MLRAAAIFGLCLAAPLRAQAPGGAAPGTAAPEIVVLLRDPSGAPVAGATGWLCVEPVHAPAALPDGLPAPRSAHSPSRREVVATSDARGVLRFTPPTDGQPPGAGAGAVTTAAGLGALLPRLHAGRAARLMLTPLAEVSTSTGSEPFTLWARATFPDGTAVTLPPLRGNAVRLPAGDYEVWSETADGWSWQRLALAPGRRTVLQFDGQAQRLAIAPDAFVHPAGWPALDLGAGGTNAVLRGAALAAPLISWLGPAQAWRVDGPRVVPGPPERLPIDWPPAGTSPAERERFTLAADAPPDATLFALSRNDRGDFRLLAAAPVRGGAFELPPRPAGDTWLLLLATDRAPAAWPWSPLPAGAQLASAPGVELVVDLRDATGLPAVDAAVEYVPDGQEAATVAAHADALGRARFGRVTGPGTLAVSDARFANQTIALARVPVEPLTVVVSAGQRCAGHARFAPGGAAATIVVTLRDPRGLLRPAERTVVAADDGAFAFDGLPEDGALVLFATARRDGRTWSARRTVLAGDDAIELQLFDEDPKLEPTGGGK